MPYRTQVSPKYQTVVYTTKHMRLDLLDRVRVLAARRRETCESIINRLLEIGLPILEREARNAVALQAKVEAQP